MHWWGWFLVWLVVAVLVALLVAAGIKLGERRRPRPGAPDDLRDLHG